jgi:iron complex transport system substrate-binding protein
VSPVLQESSISPVARRPVLPARAARLGATLSLLHLVLTGLVGGCERGGAPPAAGNRRSPTVASLVPAATDLLVAMGAGDHLVGVSNYCPARPETAGLPKVGDYRTIDWEQLAELRPAVMITQYRADKMPDGLEAKAKAYGIRLVNVRIVRLEDVFMALQALGDAIGQPDRAVALSQKLRGELDAVRERVAGRPAVRTLISRTGNPLEAVGGGNFLDDLLRVAGGQNVLAGPGYDDNSFPTIDREQLHELTPEAVLNLLPAASAQVQAQARGFWSATPDVPAVRRGAVHYLTADNLLMPGASVAQTARQFADLLHPAGALPATAPSQPARPRPGATP